MSHVDEGALHAYLDGALDALPAAEAARIRQHLESCPACARRLEEERALREEAAKILAGADPGPGAAPPLEELRQRAAARSRAGSGARVRQLAWAASLVLAVGAGWLLRGSRDPRISQALSPLLRDAAEEQTAPAPPPALPDTVSPAAPEAVRPAGEDAQPRAQTPPPAAAGGAGAVPHPMGEERAGAVAGVAAPVREEVADVAEANRLAPKTVVAPLVSPSMAVTTEARADEASAAALRSRVAFPESDRAVPSVPGLPVLAVEAGRSDLPAGTLRVLQLLEQDTLELLQLPAGADPSAVAGPGDPGRTQVAVRYGSGWLLGRARVSAEVLESLLARAVGGG